MNLYYIVKFSENGMSNCELAFYTEDEQIDEDFTLDIENIEDMEPELEDDI